MNKWLDEKNIQEYPCSPYYSRYDRQYYTTFEMNTFITSGNDIKIPQDTRRYDADILFRQLIDYCVVNHLEKSGISLINVSMKDSFYNFIYNNSLKK